MLKEVIILTILVSIGFLFMDSNASSEDFTFDVPVRVINLHPDIRSVKVVCSVSNTASPFGGVNIGQGQTEFPLMDGSYSGTAAIRFNANTGIDPGRARSWGCSLRFLRRDGRELSPAEYSEEPYGMYPLSPGAPYRTSVSGSFD